MIYKGKKEITQVYKSNMAISKIYKGNRLVWQLIKSCFGSGFWSNVKPWINEEGWKMNKI